MKTAQQIGRVSHSIMRGSVGRRGMGRGMLGATVLLAIAGCSTPGGNSGAQRYIQEGKYDQAVTELRKAVAQRPGDSDLKLALAEAESLAADQHLTRAESLIGQQRPGEALTELRVALDLMPAHPKANVMLAKVEDQATAAQKLFEQARAALDSGHSAEGVALADQALAMDQGLEGARRIRDEINTASLNEHRLRARAALESRDWPACEEAIAAMRAADPANQEATVLAKQLDDRRTAAALLSTAEQERAGNEPLAALATLQKAASLWPENTRIREARDDLEAVCVDEALRRGQTEAAAGRFDGALEALDAVLPLVPEREELQREHGRIACEWASHLMVDYERHALGEQWAEAWIVAVQAGAVCAQQLDDITPHLDRAERVLARPRSERGTTIGDMDDRVRRLFELNARGQSQQALAGLQDVFASRATGAKLEACKHLAADRLALQVRSAATDRTVDGPGPASAPAEGGQVSPRIGPMGAQRPAVPPATRPADAGELTSSARRERPPVSPRPLPASRRPRPEPPRQPAVIPEPPRAFKGILSRDDDRYPKEIRTIDNIVVKLNDTDGDPLDADIEIKVGRNSTGHDDMRVGQSLIGRGLSGQRHQLIILRIIDDTETIEFQIQPVDEGTP